MIDPSILNLQPSDPAKVARRVGSAAPPVLADELIEDFDLQVDYLKDKYQGQIGACNGHTGAAGLEYSRAMQGLPYVPLSAWWVYGSLVKGRDVGSNIMDALALLEDKGCAPEADVQWGDYSGRYSERAKANAQRFKVLIGDNLSGNWRAIVTAVAMMKPVNLALRAGNGWLVNNGSLDADGCPPVEPGPANHSVLIGGGIKTLRNGERALKCRNWWGPQWGWRGWCWIREAHVLTATWTEAYSISAAASDPQDIGFAVA